MPRTAIIQPDQSYTFADYCKLNFAPQDILAYFNVSLQRRPSNGLAMRARSTGSPTSNVASKKACPALHLPVK